MSSYNQPPPPPDTPLPIPVETAPQPATPQQPSLIAPIWHTVIIVALILCNSLLGSSKLGAVSSAGTRLLLYASTFITQLILIVIIWFGIRSRSVRLRDLIGGRWKTVEDFLLDVGIAILFWIIALLLLFGVRVALGTIDLHNLEKSRDDAVRMLAPLAPHSNLEAVFFVVLSVSAGLFEEIIFRGYLQRQFIALLHNAPAGIVVSGAIFGLAHGYQGGRMMIAIGVFGIFFGILAYVRKSLRPGMMAHALQDSIAGIAIFRLVR